MNTSTNNEDVPLEPAKIGGAFADGLTLVRLALTPIIMVIIVIGWPENRMAILASALFLIAALTDIFDDYFGGTENSVNRQFGWFDDIADTILVLGTLAAMLFVVYKQGLFGWAFGVPAIAIILREVVVGLVKGYDLTKTGWPETRFGTLKNGVIMLATCLLLASPWLTSWIDSFRVTDENVMQVYGTNSAYVWMTGQILLWAGAVLSLFTGFQLLTQKKSLTNDK